LQDSRTNAATRQRAAVQQGNYPCYRTMHMHRSGPSTADELLQAPPITAQPAPGWI